ncbi:MAG: beta-ketoacyl-[acyl-carrier-protein] synthase family protein [Neomegalonema sp.]|nr:beta-ketoacyl-[acyl-carrier-protein] synthase family protein [Neomegalonema sp.]
MTRRVVLTGLGVVSALGVGAARNFEALREGRCGIGPIQRINSDKLSIKIAAEALDFDGAELFTRSEIALRDRVTQMAIVAAREAVQQSGYALTDKEALRAGVVIGCSMGGIHTMDDSFREVYANDKQRVHPFTVPRNMPNAPASHLSMEFGLKGPAWTVTTACASSNHALGQAFQMIRSGMADTALAGGAESGLTFGVLKAWEGLRVMSRDGCRPFAKSRNGMVQGEGSAIFVLETLERAKARGATILGELIGFGMTADAHDVVQPSQDGAERAMAAALIDAGVTAEDVDYINAHGTATAANDKTETAAIRNVFGAHADKLAVSATKSMHGHCIGAAGSIELMATIYALGQGVVPPTINYDEPDPDCDLDYTPNEARERPMSVAISNSFAFGGLNAVLAARKWTGA